jgi:uncharacterized membrane protein
MRISAMHDGSAADNQVFSLFAKRNCSLEWAERWRAFWLIASISAIIACAFAVFGAWLILPFAGLEVGALYVAFRLLDRRANDYEQLTIDGDRLVVEQRKQGRLTRFEGNRLWAQVVVRKQCERVELALRYHGREIEFGAFLSDEARSHAARSLQERLRFRR